MLLKAFLAKICTFNGKNKKKNRAFHVLTHARDNLIKIFHLKVQKFLFFY